ncbi:YgfX family protein [Wenzhouxiangella sp. EGI_FJ10409]|uniref:hypothetical protein n=1 Tax=Wenzhouxiangella sp. EGI_FJ10409 TaxID=3243767 RepID=UPI0035DF189E
MQGISDQPRNDWPVGPARRSGAVVSGLIVLGLAAAFGNGAPHYVQIAVALAIVVLGGLALLRLLRPPLAGLGIDGDNVHVRAASGDRASGALVGTPFVSPVYVGFRWHEKGRRLPRSLGVFREQMDRADFRRLCARLRQRGEW